MAKYFIDNEGNRWLTKKEIDDWIEMIMKDEKEIVTEEYCNKNRSSIYKCFKFLELKSASLLFVWKYVERDLLSYYLIIYFLLYFLISVYVSFDWFM